VAGGYFLFIMLMIGVDLAFLVGDDLEAGRSPWAWVSHLADPNISYAIQLSLLTSTISAILSLWVAVPVGYLMSRIAFPGRGFVDAVLDTPIVLPPLVLGLSLLILFQTAPMLWFQREILGTNITYAIPAVIIAQFVVGAAFAVRTMRATFDQLPRRPEQVAWTLGASRAQAFVRVVLPAARRGMVASFALAWARGMGEFGPVLVFAGATRRRTEVLPTTVYLELSVGRLEPALAVSLLMIALSVLVLLLLRLGFDRGHIHDRL
jgi:molybdate transport system permease protein